MSSMKIIGILAAATFALSSAANAETIEEACSAVLEAEGQTDVSGCTCLQEQVEGNSALEEELISLRDEGGHDERYAAASAEGKAAIDACFS